MYRSVSPWKSEVLGLLLTTAKQTLYCNTSHIYCVAFVIYSFGKKMDS